MKKSKFWRTSICIALCMVMLFSTALSAAAADVPDCTEGIIPGDADSNGVANVIDAIMIANCIVGNGDVLDEVCADTYNDDIINIVDAINIVKYIAGYPEIRLGHKDMITVVEESTCRESGSARVMCQVCFDSAEKEMNPTGHYFFEGSCKNCDAHSEDYDYYKMVKRIRQSSKLSETIAAVDIDVEDILLENYGTEKTYMLANAYDRYDKDYGSPDRILVGENVFAIIYSDEGAGNGSDNSFVTMDYFLDFTEYEYFKMVMTQSTHSLIMDPEYKGMVATYTVMNWDRTIEAYCYFAKDPSLTEIYIYAYNTESGEELTLSQEEYEEIEDAVRESVKNNLKETLNILLPEKSGMSSSYKIFGYYD